MAKLSLWVQATRAPSLVTSVIPCLAGGLAAVNSGRATWWLLGAALVAMLFLHAGVNASNDVEDAARGVDGPEKERNSRVFNTGQLTAVQGRRLYATLFAVAIALGVLICIVQGPVLLVIGVLGVLGGLLYTAGPRPYKYDGLGEAFIVVLMGPLITQGAYTAVTGDAFAAQAFWLGAGPGLLIAGVLAANNLEDIDTDRAAGIRTLAGRLGFRGAQRFLAGILLATVPAQLILWAAGVFNAWVLLPLLVTPLLALRVREVLAARASDDPGLAGITGRVFGLHFLFSVLLCVAVVLARAA
ncbi:MAG TPA: prenyltransferase [Solirubrobacteraceae bacterium]|nr:prenyltransferase [Solirubrobacteraceae bacterium]